MKEGPQYSGEQLVLAGTGQAVLRIPAVALMFADTLYGAPTLLPELVNRWGAVHKILIILTVRQVGFTAFGVIDNRLTMCNILVVCAACG